jgi:hypothetical protein
MVSESAMRPGDILTASNGKTIEVINTDAEGRLTLADALIYAETKTGGKVDAIVDVATLTGERGERGRRDGSRWRMLSSMRRLRRGARWMRSWMWRRSRVRRAISVGEGEGEWGSGSQASRHVAGVRSARAVGRLWACVASPDSPPHPSPLPALASSP